MRDPIIVYFGLFKNSGEILVKDKLINLIERTFNREGSPYLACNDTNTFLFRKKSYHAWSCQNVCDALTSLFDIIFIRFGTKL